MTVLRILVTDLSLPPACVSPSLSSRLQQQSGNENTQEIQIGNVWIGNINVVIGRMEWPFSATVRFIPAYCIMHYLEVD